MECETNVQHKWIVDRDAFDQFHVCGIDVEGLQPWRGMQVRGLGAECHKNLQRTTQSGQCTEPDRYRRHRSTLWEAMNIAALNLYDPGKLNNEQIVEKRGNGPLVSHDGTMKIAH